VRTEYIQSWLGFLQPTLEANAPQAAQKNINLEILRNLPVLLPPPELQDIFDQRCSAVFSVQSQQSAATATAQATFDALLSRVFAA
jgi:type I restriction enzyme S subunit